MAAVKDAKVTLLNKSYYGSGCIAILHSVGPKNIRYTPIFEGKKGYERTEEKKNSVIIEGHNSRLITKLRNDYRKYQEDNRTRDSDRQNAIWGFQRQWDIEHPYPIWKPIDKRLPHMKGVTILKI